jgi:hypothetical protein
MSKADRGWVVINYPVVSSRATYQTGGHTHLAGNLQVYRQLGYRVVCLCRFSPRLVDRIDGAICLNLVPGAAMPRTAPIPAGAGKVGRPGLMRRIRSRAVQLVLSTLQRILAPKILHERANARFMHAGSAGSAIHLVELNDEFVPAGSCDGYLTVSRRPELAEPQFVWPWPVPYCGRFDAELFLRRLRKIGAAGTDGTDVLNVLLYGTGGVATPQDAASFVSSHPWFVGRRVHLHVYGAPADWRSGAEVTCRPWAHDSAVPAAGFDAGLLYYSPSVYDDGRLALGSPTKLWKYVDWSLPAFANRKRFSDAFLGGFDHDRELLRDPARAVAFAEHLVRMRDVTTIERYASELGNFIDAHRAAAVRVRTGQA